MCVTNVADRNFHYHQHIHEGEFRFSACSMDSHTLYFPRFRSSFVGFSIALPRLPLITSI